MTTLTCPRCGATFATQAVTNTRCRRCRTVVRVPRSSVARPSSPARTPAPAPDAEDPTETDTLSDATPLVLVVAVGAAIAVALVALALRRARQSSSRLSRPPVVPPAEVVVDPRPSPTARAGPVDHSAEEPDLLAAGPDTPSP